jgi:hypothetical protein
LHIHEPLDLAPVWALAYQHRLAGVTVINDVNLASLLADYVPYVVLRICLSDHDNPTQSYQELNADPRVIYQFGNEANVKHDTMHWLTQMYTADAHNGRKVVIFNDAVGCTEDIDWIERRPALEYAKTHGHYVGLHAYGIVTDGGDIYHPLTELSGWRWFGGRWEYLYSLMPPEAQPAFIATEAGAGGFQRNATALQWLVDVQRMNALTQVYPWFKAFNLWDVTRLGMGFDQDIINDYLPFLLL